VTTDGPHERPAPPAAPTACPFCTSPQIAAATEKVDAFTYWRCKACGQMWNVERLRLNNPRRGYWER
jgi:formate dehydrogenase maturation protein FdhE